MVLAPIVRGRKGEYGKQLEELRGEGFTRVEDRRRAAPARRGDRARQEVQARHRGRRRPAGDEGRPAQAAGRLGRDGGRAGRRPGRDRAGRSSERDADALSEKFACPVHGPSLVELEPRIFSFNSPHGACPRCTGLGSQMEIDPELVVPDPALSIGEGAIAPVGGQRLGLLRAADAGDRRALRRRPRRRRGRTCPQEPARLLPVRHQRRSLPGRLPQPLRPPPHLLDPVRGHRPGASSAATARPTPSSRGRRSRST